MLLRAPIRAYRRPPGSRRKLAREARVYTCGAFGGMVSRGAGRMEFAAAYYLAGVGVIVHGRDWGLVEMRCGNF